MLEGFSFNRKNNFESVLRCEIGFNNCRVAKSATVSVPDIWTHLHLYNPDKYMLFRVVSSLAVLSDISYDNTRSSYQCASIYNDSVITVSDWFPTSGKVDGFTLDLNLTAPNALVDCENLVLNIGVEFGSPLSHQSIMPIKYAGSAKIACVF
jgi:hypothetical protein